jgi:hypothetical protein
VAKEVKREKGGEGEGSRKGRENESKLGRVTGSVKGG